MEIGQDEREHVLFLRQALGSAAVAKPAINLSALSTGFGDESQFLALARDFEDVGVSAYGGAAPLLVNKTFLGYAAQILATEAEHVGNVRLQIARLNIPTTPLDSKDVLPPPSGTQFMSNNAHGLSVTRTPGQVLYIVYGFVANVTQGGFFHNGVNGVINMSSGPP